MYALQNWFGSSKKMDPFEYRTEMKLWSISVLPNLDSKVDPDFFGTQKRSGCNFSQFIPMILIHSQSIHWKANKVVVVLNKVSAKTLILYRIKYLTS